MRVNVCGLDRVHVSVCVKKTCKNINSRRTERGRERNRWKRKLKKCGRSKRREMVETRRQISVELPFQAAHTHTRAADVPRMRARGTAIVLLGVLVSRHPLPRAGSSLFCCFAHLLRKLKSMRKIKTSDQSQSQERAAYLNLCCPRLNYLRH